jgi:hypothetical protein
MAAPGPAPTNEKSCFATSSLRRRPSPAARPVSVPADEAFRVKWPAAFTSITLFKARKSYYRQSECLKYL